MPRKISFCLFLFKGITVLFEGTCTSVSKKKRAKSSLKIVEIKVFLIFLNVDGSRVVDPE
jgi:hypothetical protein